MLNHKQNNHPFPFSPFSLHKQRFKLNTRSLTMGEKKVENRKKENGGNKNTVTTVVLKADLHCEGCVSKVLKCIRSFDGVENASIGDGQMIRVVGKVIDPAKLRERLEKKTHRRVELISPQPKKEDDQGKSVNNNGGKQEKKKEEEENGKSKKWKSSKFVEKKNKVKKELPVTTAVMKVNLHCEGCTQKINKLVTKTKGYEDIKIDKQKHLVTVTGAMDMTALAKVLNKHLKRKVEILPVKKEVEKKDNNNNKNNNGGVEKAKDGGDKGKIAAVAGGDKGKIGGGDGGEKLEGNKVRVQVEQPDPVLYYGSGCVVERFEYSPCEFGSYHAPQMFSDENPNACSVM